MSLQIIGAGFGRTGTASLQAALEELGFAPCHHMFTVITQPGRAEVWHDVMRRRRQGEAVDWTQIFAGFEATVDWPGCTFWRELLATFPEAKMLLTVRDPERWYESVATTIYQTSRADPSTAAGISPEMVERLRTARRFIRKLIWEETFGGRFEDREHAIRVFTEHNAAVIAAVPPERLLVYEVKQGWEPLCRFLGVEVPADKPFPHLNDSASFLARFAQPNAEQGERFTAQH